MSEWKRSPECPECGDVLRAFDDSSRERCESCGQLCWIRVDGDMDDAGHPFNLYRVTRDDPPDWREVQGALRFHGGL